MDQGKTKENLGKPMETNKKQTHKKVWYITTKKNCNLVPGRGGLVCSNIVFLVMYHTFFVFYCFYIWDLCIVLEYIQKASSSNESDVVYSASSTTTRFIYRIRKHQHVQHGPKQEQEIKRRFGFFFKKNRKKIDFFRNSS